MNTSIEALKKRVKKLEKEVLSSKRIEKDLRKSEEKYRVLVKNIPSIVYKGYKDWSVEFFNKKIKLFTGYDLNEFNSRKMKWIDIIIKEDIKTARESFIQALKTDKSYVREYRIKSKSGDIHWIQERSQIVCDNNGEIEHISGIFLDITERKQAEEELRRHRDCLEELVAERTGELGKINKELQQENTKRKKLEQDLLQEKIFSESVINSLPDTFFIVDDKGKFLRWNKNFEKLSEYSAEEISKMNPLDFFIEENKKFVDSKIQEVFKKGGGT